jgi:proteic killer suppression protein
LPGRPRPFAAYPAPPAAIFPRRPAIGNIRGGRLQISSGIALGKNMIDTWQGLTVCNGHRYIWSVIKSFASREMEYLFRGRSSRRLPGHVQRRALQKLLAIHAAVALDELGRIPSNRLEKLKGTRAARHSVRINDQWRICFVWRDGDAYEVEIVDYHR